MVHLSADGEFLDNQVAQVLDVANGDVDLKIISRGMFLAELAAV
jgi:hypothetical protein